MNRIAIHGRLTRNPELKNYTNKKGEEGSLVNFSVAVDRQFGEGTDFFTCTCFGKRAEAINKFFSKGKEIVVCGSMQCDPYEDKNGNKRYPWKLMVEQFDFCGSKKDDAGSSGSASDEDVPDGFEAVNDEDIPF